MPGVANGDSISVDDIRVTVAPVVPARRCAPHPRACRCFASELLLLLLRLLLLLLPGGNNAEADDEHERQYGRGARLEDTEAGGANAPAGDAWSEATAAAVTTHRPTKLWLLIVQRSFDVCLCV